MNSAAPPTIVSRMVRSAPWGLLCALVVCSSGCRLFQRDGGSGGTSATPTSGRRDPLFGPSRIPATNLPTTARDGTKRDPLLTTPVTREANDLNSEARREPYRPTRDTTAAGLAGGRNLPDDADADPRQNATATGRGRESYDQAVSELKRLNVQFDEATREGGEFVMRGELVTGRNGSVRRYEGAGQSAAAAARQLLEQVREVVGN